MLDLPTPASPRSTTLASINFGAPLEDPTPVDEETNPLFPGLYAYLKGSVFCYPFFTYSPYEVPPYSYVFFLLPPQQPPPDIIFKTIIIWEQIYKILNILTVIQVQSVEAWYYPRSYRSPWSGLHYLASSVTKDWVISVVEGYLDLHTVLASDHIEPIVVFAIKDLASHHRSNFGIVIDLL